MNISLNSTAVSQGSFGFFSRHPYVAILLILVVLLILALIFLYLGGMMHDAVHNATYAFIIFAILFLAWFALFVALDYGDLWIAGKLARLLFN